MDLRKPVAIAPALLAALVLAGPAAPAQDEPAGVARSCQDDPRRAQLDFWIGTWRVVDAGPGGEVLGHGRVEKRHGGCVLVEGWRDGRSGASGEGLTFFDPADGRWHQVWVDGTGTVVRWAGEARDGSASFEGRITSVDGTEWPARAVLERLPDGRVRQRIERSEDGGATWQPYFEGVYEPLEDRAASPGPEPDAAPRAAEPPAPVPAPAEPPRPAPAPEPGPEEPAPPAPEERGGVTAVSVEVPDESVPPEERPRIHLQSPMVLEVPLGPVEAIPEAYSWSTRDTTRYVVEATTIRQVTVSRSEGRNRVDLEVTVALHSSRYLQRADLGVELLAGDEVVTAARLGDFPVGRSLAAQSQGPGLEKTLVLGMDRETFRAVFVGDERPVLRLSLTVRE